MVSFSKKNLFLSAFRASLVDLPSPKNITYLWNFGSLLGLMLVIQLSTGVFLSLHYSSDLASAFYSVSHMMRDVNGGWLIRVCHANGASFFFVFAYLHLFRGLYYFSYKLLNVWMIGVSILLLMMASAFLGYVLPWGQMSFWGATVITNLFSVIPHVGASVVTWLWGGFAVGGPTLSRFFGFHFLAPFILSVFVLGHLLYLHETGSSNPIGISSDFSKLKFNPYFLWKDLIGGVGALILFMFLILLYPWILGDSVNFIPANPLSTPLHIQPEWYFLFAYAILRSIPSKMGGVLALAFSVLILYFLPLSKNKVFCSSQFSISHKFIFWWFCNVVFLLTWIGARPVESPYLFFGQMFTYLYFSYFFLLV